MKNLVMLIAILSFCSCATIIKNSKQTVTFTGGLEDGSTKVATPEGNYTLADGSTSALLTRTKSDIPIQVTCNGKTNKGILPTHYDVGWAGLGNIIFGGIPGWIIDGIGDKGYDIQDSFNVGALCKQGNKDSAADKVDNAGRIPSSENRNGSPVEK